jgi:hypothetical protein
MNGSVFSPLIRLASPTDPTLEGLARRLALPTAGMLVFNPSPFGQSGTVAVPGGGLRVVTNVPGLGYAFEPARAPVASGSLAPTREPLQPIETAHFSARLDPATGAVASVVERQAGRELARSPGGLNRIDGSALTDGWVERHPGVGLRLVARRAGPAGAFTSHLTIHDALPWVEIENIADSGGSLPPDTGFDLAMEPRPVTREVPGGAMTGTPPIERAPMLRWLSLAADDETLLFGSATPAAVTVTDTGRLTVHGAGNGTRFRLAIARGFVLPDEPWRFGFAMAALIAVPAPGAGDLTLPTFGRLLDVADPAVAVVGIKDADDGVGVAVYLMDLAGVGREVVVRPGVLTFDGALETDLTEVDRGRLDSAPGAGVVARLEAHGYAALRLLGVRVAG